MKRTITTIEHAYDEYDRIDTTVTIVDEYDTADGDVLPGDEETDKSGGFDEVANKEDTSPRNPYDLGVGPPPGLLLWPSTYPPRIAY